VSAKIWFCDTEILSVSLHPLDSQEQVYSVFTLQKDPASPFGYGVPWLIRDHQSILNTAWRMMMDNAKVSLGPQIEIDKSRVAPEDNNYKMEAMKIWVTTAGLSNTTQPAIKTYDIPMHQEMYAAIIAMVLETVDEVIGMPRIAQGETGSMPQQTASGMAILMNSANVTFRRIIKNYDDDVIVPTIRRFYHWNMQFHDDETIKGDFEVDARGSSVLLVREMQAEQPDHAQQHPSDRRSHRPRRQRPEARQARPARADDPSGRHTAFRGQDRRGPGPAVSGALGRRDAHEARRGPHRRP
jgi:hypothetical protein